MAPDAGAIASLMSHHHGYLAFVGGNRLDKSLTSAHAFAQQWQADLTAMNNTVYAVASPPQVASAFVLQHLLSIPAQIAAFAAMTGPWNADLGTLQKSPLTFDLAPGLYPQRLGFMSVTAVDEPLDVRLDRAHTAYAQLGRDLATSYDAGVRMSSRKRLGMVDDLWQMALREARAALGHGLRPAVERQSCCFIFALPGCHECAGCPRLSNPPEEATS